MKFLRAISFPAIILIAICLVFSLEGYKYLTGHIHAQSNVLIAGGAAQTPTAQGAPSGFFSCTDAMKNILYIDNTPTAINAGRFWQCNNAGGSYTWINLPAPSDVYLNGVLQSVPKCAFYTGTTSAGGTITFNITALGLTSLIGQPQPSVQSSSAALVSLGPYSNTAITLNTQTGTVVTILTFSVTLFSAGAAPVGVYFCGF